MGRKNVKNGKKENLKFHSVCTHTHTHSHTHTHTHTHTHFTAYIYIYIYIYILRILAASYCADKFD